jgi:uncharacterized protein
MMDRQGVEIDYCPQCRGVWLDRGELDKLIERAATHLTGSSPRQMTVGDDRREPYSEQRREYEYRRRDDDYDDDDHRYRGRRRRGWLGDMFDFD